MRQRKNERKNGNCKGTGEMEGNEREKLRVGQNVPIFSPHHPCPHPSFFHLSYTLHFLPSLLFFTPFKTHLHPLINCIPYSSPIFSPHHPCPLPSFFTSLSCTLHFHPSLLFFTPFLVCVPKARYT